MDELLNVELAYRSIEPPLRWEAIFGNHAPVTLEIGFGKCGFLTTLAAQNPTRNFIGIEVSRKYHRKGVRKIERAALPNVKLLHGEALHILTRYIADQSIAAMYLNCPDPWPKKGHAKRRLVSAAFVDAAAQKLVPGGKIEIATDVPAYFQQVLDLFQLQEHAAFHRCFAQTSQEGELERPARSEYEQVFLKAGKVLHYAAYQKVAG